MTTYLSQNGQTKTIDGEGPFPFVFHSFCGDILWWQVLQSIWIVAKIFASMIILWGDFVTEMGWGWFLKRFGDLEGEICSILEGDSWVWGKGEFWGETFSGDKERNTEGSELF